MRLKWIDFDWYPMLYYSYSLFSISLKDRPPSKKREPVADYALSLLTTNEIGFFTRSVVVLIDRSEFAWSGMIDPSLR